MREPVACLGRTRVGAQEMTKKLSGRRVTLELRICNKQATAESINFSFSLFVVLGGRWNSSVRRSVHEGKRKRS
jgi:hypothetical protein